MRPATACAAWRRTACGIAFAMLAGTPASAAGPLSSDHLEALERGCAAGAAPERAACRRDALTRLAARGGPLDTGALPASQRNAARVACAGIRDAGLERYDECLRRIVGGAAPVRPRDPAPAVPPIGAPPPPPGQPRTAQAVFAAASPSVLMVVANMPGGEVRQGSAVAVTRLLLLTNCHVVSGAAAIRGLDSATTRPLRVVAEDRPTDRCVLAAERGDLRPIAATRAAGGVAVGEAVFTIGSPRGLHNTLAEGLVSGIRRLEGRTMIQTTAPIAPGSSGGGLFDGQGRLLGITTFMVGDRGSLHFAIAADEYAPLLALAGQR